MVEPRRAASDAIAAPRSQRRFQTTCHHLLQYLGRRGKQSTTEKGTAIVAKIERQQIGFELVLAIGINNCANVLALKGRFNQFWFAPIDNLELRHQPRPIEQIQ